MDEWEDIEQRQQHDEPELISAKGSIWSLMRGTKPPTKTIEQISDIRERLENQIRGIVFSQDTGAWLFRHAAGVGKTYTFGNVADEYYHSGLGLIACAPTVAEAEVMALNMGTWVLRSQGPANCQQMAVEMESNVSDGLLAHRSNHHRASSYCKQCPFRESCTTTEGQYRHDQKKFHTELSQGIVFCATTVAMLGYIATAINESKYRIVVWTDEDLLPHVASDIDKPLTHAELLEWVHHANAVYANEQDVLFVKSMISLLEDDMPERESDSPDMHGTGADSCAWRIPSHRISELREMAELSLKRLKGGATHPSEQLDEHGEPLPLGRWRRAIMRPLIDLVMGVCWIHRDASGYRELIGKIINREILALPKNHALLQSDATASPELWANIWRGSYRGYFDCMPQRAAEVVWHVGSMGKGGASAESNAVMLSNIIAHQVKVEKKRVGLITFKAWAAVIQKRLRAKHVSSELISKDGNSKKTKVLIGWYGAHDRGVNAFHEHGIDALYIVGAFRLPMSAYYQSTAALLEMGATIPMSDLSSRARVGPTSDEGEYIVQRANNATVSNDSQTTWLVDHERAAALTQAVERVRSVDRAAKGMPVAEVHLYGLDATQLHVPFSVSYVI